MGREGTRKGINSLQNVLSLSCYFHSKFVFRGPNLGSISDIRLIISSTWVCNLGCLEEMSGFPGANKCETNFVLYVMYGVRNNGRRRGTFASFLISESGRAACQGVLDEIMTISVSVTNYIVNCWNKGKEEEVQMIMTIRAWTDIANNRKAMIVSPWERRFESQCFPFPRLI